MVPKLKVAVLTVINALAAIAEAIEF